MVHLQEDVEHVRMGFFHLIKEHHGVGFATNSFGQLTPLVESDVP